jgi:Leucine-rich repeat (LRR) protein
MNKLTLCLFLLISNYSFSQSGGYYNNLDSALSNPKQVITLDLSKQKLKEVPSKIILFENLERLILKRNRIKEIPKELSSLTKLHYIDISSNYINEIPKELSSLTLDTLIMWDNKLREFPLEYERMGQSLLYLDLRAIQMTKKEQKQIKKLFPKAKIRLAPYCNCNR